MLAYTEMTTVELIDLLFKEEDRVTAPHARELINRGAEAACALREILANEDYWYEGQGGDHWIVVHAVNILGAMQDELALPVLIEMVPHAYFSNHDSAVEVLPAALAEYGAAALEPYMKFIDEYRGAYRDNPDFSHCRHTVSAALTRIALKDESARARVSDFINGLFANRQEDDSIFLSFSAGHPVALDKAPGKERSLQAVRAAYERGTISQEINGSFKEFTRMVRERHPNLFNDLKSGLFDFYKPEAIERRRRARAEQADDDPYWPEARMDAPVGYTTAEGGGLQRTEKIGRNDPCPCGSGKKYKKCCGQ
ncbi:MAG TPA: SEC-C metal-binding domain-containing protein [Blastocatellia bacterium]|nr:SEC-C metal-binding domain-containing protein [Blastocatellia bacterium]